MKNQKNCTTQRMRHQEQSRRQPPVLRLSPTAWAKLLYLRDYGETEVGGFGISAPGDPLLVEDVRLVKQICSWAEVKFDDASVADFFDDQVDAGRKPEEFGRIWVHTHPGNSPRPSWTDEETFARVFGRAEWAVMFILAREGQTYARLRFNVGPGAEIEIPTSVEYGRAFGGSTWDDWEREYASNVQSEHEVRRSRPIAAEAAASSPFDEDQYDDWYESWEEYIDEETGQEGASI